MPALVRIPSAIHSFYRLRLRADTKEKPYSCSCGHSFSRKDLLTRHERLAHASGRNSEEQSGVSLSSTDSSHVDAEST